MNIKVFLSTIIICVLLSFQADARDKYSRSNNNWVENFNIENNVKVSSVVYLNDFQIKLVRKIYYQTKSKFVVSFDFKNNYCDKNELSIKIVKNHHELNSRKYFPDENVYADEPHEGTDIIFGRYYPYKNTLYIVPPDTIEYYWESNFSHELLHYFFDICNVKFKTDHKEHLAIDQFLKKHKDTFNYRKGW